MLLGNRRDCNNYRGISLLNVAYKVYALIVTRRLNVINEYILSEEQCGFRKGRSCSDCIFIMEQFIKKRREFNLPTCILFIDFEKAFDRVPRGKLWNIMKNKGFPDHIVKTVQSLRINTRIKIDKGTSVSNEEIHINQGVKQECPMSPTLFNTFIDEVIRQW
jgi:sorting nexin-29